MDREIPELSSQDKLDFAKKFHNFLMDKQKYRFCVITKHKPSQLSREAGVAETVVLVGEHLRQSVHVDQSRALARNHLREELPRNLKVNKRSLKFVENALHSQIIVPPTFGQLIRLVNRFR